MASIFEELFSTADNQNVLCGRLMTAVRVFVLRRVFLQSQEQQSHLEVKLDTASLR